LIQLDFMPPAGSNPGRFFFWLCAARRLAQDRFKQNRESGDERSRAVAVFGFAGGGAA
jgi:hypothetical protein